jgi:hypothetical protein
MSRKVSKNKHFSGRRKVIAIIGGLFILVGAAIGILNIQGIIQGHFSDIISLIVSLQLVYY